MALEERYTFTSEQLDQYFDRIVLPKSKRTTTVSDLNDNDKLAFLQTLLKHHQIRIPFENLTQHYSWHRVIDLHPLHLFRKIVHQPGRGGYCMENNNLFHTVLRSLGYTCYLAAGRVWTPDGRWTGWSHLVNLVMIGGTKYLGDVAFGANEPTVPLPLVHGTVSPQVPPTESRLVFETLPEGVSNSKLWIHQYRFDPSKDWTPAYCFTETELLPGDLSGLNYSPWIGRTSIFTQKILCVRYTTAGESIDTIDGLPNEQTVVHGEVEGTLTLYQDNLKWRCRGENVLDVLLNSEEERLDALKKYWGIELDVEDQMAIKGTISAIRPKQ